VTTGAIRAAMVAALVGGAMTTGTAADPADQVNKAGSMRSRILVHVTHGPEQPTRAALAFLVAKSALDEGHAVTLFLAGDAVLLVRDAVLDSVSGVGTGKLRDSYEAIVKAGGRFYLSGMSSQARGLTAAELAGKPAEFAQPAVLVRLSLEHDRMFTY
jgi:predicted peroxiredoxin